MFVQLAVLAMGCLVAAGLVTSHRRAQRGAR